MKIEKETRAPPIMKIVGQQSSSTLKAVQEDEIKEYYDKTKLIYG